MVWHYTRKLSLIRQCELRPSRKRIRVMSSATVRSLAVSAARDDERNAWRLLPGFVDNFAADYRHRAGRLEDFGFGDFHNVGGENGEVGELAGFD
jgi:hypothetical protein